MTDTKAVAEVKPLSERLREGVKIPAYPPKPEPYEIGEDGGPLGAAFSRQEDERRLAEWHAKRKAFIADVLECARECEALREQLAEAKNAAFEEAARKLDKAAQYANEVAESIMKGEHPGVGIEANATCNALMDAANTVRALKASTTK